MLRDGYGSAGAEYRVGQKDVMMRAAQQEGHSVPAEGPAGSPTGERNASTGGHDHPPADRGKWACLIPREGDNVRSWLWTLTASFCCICAFVYTFTSAKIVNLAWSGLFLVFALIGVGMIAADRGTHDLADEIGRQVGPKKPPP